MSAAPQTKLFGINFGVDPKFIVGGLLAVALLVLFFNSRSSNSSEGSSGSAAESHSVPAIAYPGSSAGRSVHRRNRQSAQDRGTLRIRPIDATRGDVDPTLRLDLLQRLQNIAAAAPGRSLFEVGSAAPMPSLETVNGLNKRIHPGPLPGSVKPAPPPPPSDTTLKANIPLRFYGFVKPAAGAQRNQGLFMNGDNVVLATEGDLVEQRYLVVELTPNTAKMEDTQIKQSQTLTVVPEANQQ